MDIYERLCLGFENGGFDTGGGSPEYRCFFRSTGTVEFVVCVMRKDMLGEKIYGLSDIIFDNIKNSLTSERLIFIALYAGETDERLCKFCNVPDFTPDDKYVYMKWIADGQSKKLIVNGNQPKKMLSAEKIIKKALEGKEEKTENRGVITEIPYFTYIVIAVYFLFFAAEEMNGGSENIDTIIKMGAVYAKGIYSGEYYRLFTAMFIHMGIMHIVCNAFSLYIMGSRVERYCGSLFFVCCYIFSGLCASAGALYFSPEAITAGGSGAIFGVEGAAAVYTTLKMKKLDGLNYHTVLIFVIFGLASGFMVSNVSNVGHICGLIGGIIFSAVWLGLFGG